MVISPHKSISLGNSKYISTEFSNFVSFKNKENTKLYIDEIFSKRPQFFLTWDLMGTRFLADLRIVLVN